MTAEGEADTLPDVFPELSRAHVLELTKTLTSIVWTCDPQGRFTSPQSSWQQYTGQSWEEQQGLGWFQAIHPDDRDSVLAEMMRGLENKSHYRGEGRLWHSGSQTYRYCEARGMPVLGERGEIREWVGTCVDVDDYKRAEETLKTADQRKDDFIAVLAHEFRNLLAPVRTTADILMASGLGTAQQYSMGTSLGGQVDQISRLLEDLLDVSRITSQQMVLQKVRVTVDSIVKASLETSRPVLEQHAHHFELNVLAGPLWVEADPTRLAQVFTNLLNNAAKYTDRGGKVSLTIRSEGDYVAVAVNDNGIGIEPEMLARVFQMFSRTASAVQRSRDGLGIGLAVVRGIVEAHDGTVHAYSQGVGHGSEFVVRIPLVP